MIINIYAQYAMKLTVEKALDWYMIFLKIENLKWI